MIDDLFILIIGTSYYWSFIESLHDYIEEEIHTVLPTGSELIACKQVINYPTIKVLKILDRLNSPPGYVRSSTDYVDERGLFRLTIETDTPLRYKRLPWLETFLKKFIADGDIVGGVYFPYLIKEDGELKFATPNRLKIEEKEMEDVEDDDWEFLFEHSQLLNAIYYGQPIPEDSIYKEAKLALLR
jgi:hypothetical protein